MASLRSRPDGPRTQTEFQPWRWPSDRSRSKTSTSSPSAEKKSFCSAMIQEIRHSTPGASAIFILTRDAASRGGEAVSPAAALAGRSFEGESAREHRTAASTGSTAKNRRRFITQLPAFVSGSESTVCLGFRTLVHARHEFARCMPTTAFCQLRSRAGSIAPGRPRFGRSPSRLATATVWRRDPAVYRAAYTRLRPIMSRRPWDVAR